MRLRTVLAATLLVSACGGTPDTFRTVNIAADTFDVVRGARMVAVIGNLAQPESVVHDAEQDVYFVSNMRGAGSSKNNAGYIVRIDARAPMDTGGMSIAAQGGRDGVTLHAPKGLALSGDVLWVADIDFVRGFDRRTGRPVGQYDLRAHGATMLNALTVGPDGTLYATDTGIHMTDQGVLYPRGDRIFALAPDGVVSEHAEGFDLELPNGIAWDAAHDRLVVASFNPYRGSIYTIDGSGTKQEVVRTPARLDGLQILDDGRIVTTSWGDHSVRIIEGGRDYAVIPHRSTAADLGVDRTRKLLLVPLVLSGRVELWTYPAARQ